MTSRSSTVQTRGPARGFTLVELMMVISIIALLISMTVTGIWGARRHFSKTEARLTMQAMHTGLTSLKRNAEYDPMTPLGVYTAGQTAEGTTTFTDAGRDFVAEGIAVDDVIYILGDDESSERVITAVSGTQLTLDGANFTSSELAMDYFIIKSSGEGYPEINLPKELNPSNSAWSGTFTAHLNGRKRLYYPCKEKRIRNGEFLDPWGKLYVYSLALDDDTIVEKITCGGPDGVIGTNDDLEEVMTEIPFGG